VVRNSLASAVLQHHDRARCFPSAWSTRNRQDVPSVDHAIVLDRSGSMTAIPCRARPRFPCRPGRGLRMNVLPAERLFGVIAVEVRCPTVVPLAQARDKGRSRKRSCREAGGGGSTSTTSSGRRPAPSSAHPRTEFKHVILFSRRGDAEEKSAGERGDGARTGSSRPRQRMLSSKITT